MPSLKDVSGALASRFILLTVTESFYNREDHTLTPRLLEELPGILNWAITGWQRLQARGHFVQPASSENAVRELEDLASPVGAFVRECCVVEPGRKIGTGRLFDLWCEWCTRHGRQHPGTAQLFGRDLRAVVPGLTTSQKHDGSRQYLGIATVVEGGAENE